MGKRSFLKKALPQEKTSKELLTLQKEPQGSVFGSWASPSD